MAQTKREQPKRPLGEAQELHQRQLGPQEEDRADLPIVERPEQVEVVAADEVDRDESLVPPERVVHRVADEPKQHAQNHERPGRPLQAPVELLCVAVHRRRNDRPTIIGDCGGYPGHASDVLKMPAADRIAHSLTRVEILARPAISGKFNS